MNAPSAEPPSLAASPSPDAGWSRRKWFTLLLLAIGAHVALVFLLGTNKTPAPRTAANAPQFYLISGNAEIVALTDPTLFVVPHGAADFIPARWGTAPDVAGPSFSWTEPVPFLSPAPENLGASFSAFMETNQFTNLKLDFKPAPRFATPAVMVESALPKQSTMQFSGELARRLLVHPALPVLGCNDVLNPDRVQMLVDEAGIVLSVVLLDSSDNEEADRRALEAARATRFKPAAGVTFGEMTVNWHTVPTNAP